MKTPALIYFSWRKKAWRHKPWHPRHLSLLIEDLSGAARQPEQDHRTHLRATLEWLCRAQDASRRHGEQGCLCDGWTFESGWLPGSPDSTGRMIETLIPAAKYLAWPDLMERGAVMLEWVLANLPPADKTSFGVLHGLVAGHVQLQQPACLEAALPMAGLLCQAEDRTTLQHAQAAWILCRIGSLTDDKRMLHAAQKHLDIVLPRQTPSGWFMPASGRGHPASLSTIAATQRGLIESAVLLGHEACLQAAERCMRSLRAHLRSDGWMAAVYDDGWTPAARHACVSGIAQIAVVWLRLAQIRNDSEWRNAAWRAIAYVKRTQRTHHESLAVRDAIPSAAPLWGGGRAFSYHAESAKYFADALMMDMVNITIPPAPNGVPRP